MTTNEQKTPPTAIDLSHIAINSTYVTQHVILGQSHFLEQLKQAALQIQELSLAIREGERNARDYEGKTSSLNARKEILGQKLQSQDIEFTGILMIANLAILGGTLALAPGFSPKLILGISLLAGAATCFLRQVYRGSNQRLESLDIERAIAEIEIDLEHIEDEKSKCRTLIRDAKANLEAARAAEKMLLEFHEQELNGVDYEALQLEFSGAAFTSKCARAVAVELFRSRYNINPGVAEMLLSMNQEEFNQTMFAANSLFAGLTNRFQETRTFQPTSERAIDSGSAN